jgi:hypothetical protein
MFGILCFHHLFSDVFLIICFRSFIFGQLFGVICFDHLFLVYISVISFKVIFLGHFQGQSLVMF